MADIFLDKRTQGQKGIWKWFGRNKFFCSSVLLSTNIKTCLSGTIFLDRRTKEQKGDMGIECLIETNHLFFCSCVYR